MGFFAHLSSHPSPGGPNARGIPVMLLDGERRATGSA
jgi:hypothetical protein